MLVFLFWIFLLAIVLLSGLPDTVVCLVCLAPPIIALVFYLMSIIDDKLSKDKED